LYQLYQPTGTKSHLVTETPLFLAAKNEMRWHLEHGERVPRALCAGCRRPIGDGEALDLADDNVVHIDAEYRCLIAWGEAWRSAAGPMVVAAGDRSAEDEGRPSND
jgi:hypothetical protein